MPLHKGGHHAAGSQARELGTLRMDTAMNIYCFSCNSLSKLLFTAIHIYYQ